jgi:hypothetical protein
LRDVLESDAEAFGTTQGMVEQRELTARGVLERSKNARKALVRAQSDAKAEAEALPALKRSLSNDTDLFAGK